MRLYCKRRTPKISTRRLHTRLGLPCAGGDEEVEDTGAGSSLVCGLEALRFLRLLPIGSNCTSVSTSSAEITGILVGTWNSDDAVDCLYGRISLRGDMVRDVEPTWCSTKFKLENGERK